MGNESKVTYKVNGTIVDLPEESVGALLKKYPNAEPLKSYIVGADTVDLPEASVPALLKKYPDARPTFETIPTVKLSKSQLGEQRERTADELTKGVFANQPQEQPFQGMVGSPKPQQPQPPASIYSVSKPTDLTDPKAISELSAQQERNTANANKAKEKAQSTAYVLDNIKKKSELPVEEPTVDPTIKYTFTGATSDSDRKYDQTLLKEGMAYADEMVEREKIARPLMDEYTSYLEQTKPDVAASKLASLGYTNINNPDEYDSKLGSFFNEAASWKYNTEKDNIKKLAAELATPLKQLEALGDYFKKTQAQYPDGQLPKEEYDNYLKAQEEFKRITGDEKFKELAMWVESNDETTQTLKQYPVLFKKSYDEAVAKTAEQIKQDAEYKNMSAFGRGYGVLWRAVSKQSLNTVSDALAGALRTGGANKSAELIKGTLEAVSDNMVLPSYQDQSYVDNFYDYKGYKVYVNDEGKVIDIRDKEGYIIPSQPTYDKLNTEFTNKYTDQPKSTWDIKEKREYRTDLLVGKLAEQAVSMAALVGGAGYLKAAGLGAKTALTLSGYLSSYEGNYQTAIQSGMTEGSLEARTFAGAASVLTGYLENISPNLPILKKKGFMTAFKDSYMKALATKTPKLAVAKAFSDIMVMQPLQEVTQELSQSAADRAIQAATNAVAGRQYFDTSYDMDEDIETAVLTYLTTVPFTALTGGGLKRANSELKRSAIYYGATHYDSAVSKLDQLLESGKIDLRNYTSAKKSIEEGKKHLDKLPESASEETKAELLDLIVHRENLKKQQTLIDSESGILKYEMAIQKASASIEKILDGAGVAEIREEEAKASRKANEAAQATERKANYVPPMDETVQPPIVESLEVQDRESAVGQSVNYGGIQGVLTKNDNGYHVIDTDGNLHLIEGGESQATNDEIGLTKGNIVVQPITQPKAENGEATVKVDLPTARYDFKSNTLQLNGREFEVVGVEKDKKGNETSIVLKDKQEGWGVKVSDQNLILEYLIQQELNTPQAITITPNEITAAAAEIGIAEPQVEVKPAGEQAVEQVQQSGTVGDIKAVEEVVAKEQPTQKSKPGEAGSVGVGGDVESRLKQNDKNLEALDKKQKQELAELNKRENKNYADAFDILNVNEYSQDQSQRSKDAIELANRHQQEFEALNNERKQIQEDADKLTFSDYNFENKKSILDKLKNAIRDVFNKDKQALDSGFEVANQSLDAALEVGADQYVAHGMGKTNLANAFNDLITLFTKGINPSKGRGSLDIAPLAGGVSTGTTSSGNAYMDGAFTLVANRGHQGAITNINQVGGIIVNEGMASKEVINALRELFPNLVIESTSNTKSLVEQLNRKSKQSLKETTKAETKVTSDNQKPTEVTSDKKSIEKVKVKDLEVGDEVVLKGKEGTWKVAKKTKDGVDLSHTTKQGSMFKGADDGDIEGKVVNRSENVTQSESLKETTKAETPTTNTGVEEGSGGVGGDVEVFHLVENEGLWKATTKSYRGRDTGNWVYSRLDKKQTNEYNKLRDAADNYGTKEQAEENLKKLKDFERENKEAFQEAKKAIDGLKQEEERQSEENKKQQKIIDETSKELDRLSDKDFDKLVELIDEKRRQTLEQRFGDRVERRTLFRTPISESYHAAKADGSNPELVKAVEQSLKETPTETGSVGVGGDVDLSKAKLNYHVSKSPQGVQGEVRFSDGLHGNGFYTASDKSKVPFSGDSEQFLILTKKPFEENWRNNYRDKGVNDDMRTETLLSQGYDTIKTGDYEVAIGSPKQVIKIGKGITYNDILKQATEYFGNEKDAADYLKSKGIEQSIKEQPSSEKVSADDPLVKASEPAGITGTAEPTKEATKTKEDEKGKSNEGEAAKESLLNETKDAAENAAKPLDEQAQKIRELFKNKGLNLGDSSVSFSKTNHADLQATIRAEKEPLKRKILQDIDKVITSLVKVMPDIKVVLHDSQTSFETAIPESIGLSVGAAFKDGAIHLNMENIYASGKTNFVYHEAVHPVLDALAEQNPALIDKLYNELGNYEFGSKYKSFGYQYDDVQGKKEAIVEFIADVANGDLNITPQRLPKVKLFFAKVLRAIGLGKLADGVTSKKQLIELAASINNSFSNGLSVKGVRKGTQLSKINDDNFGGFVTRDGKPIGFNYDTDKVARERFDFSKLKQIGKGSDRTVFDLGDGKVLKVAHTARGLEQNIYEGDYYLKGIIPEVFERGLNYVVVEKIDSPTISNPSKSFEVDETPNGEWAVFKKGTDYRYGDTFKTKELAEDARKRISAAQPDEVESKAQGVGKLKQLLSELKQFTQKDFDNHDSELQEVLEKYELTDIMSYDVLWGDFIAKRNWGVKDGEPIHLDGGTFGGVKMITSHRGKTNLSDPEFRKIYEESKRLKKKFGDTDKNTMFSKTLSDESVGVVAQAIRAKASEGVSYHEAAQYVMDELEAAGIIDPKDPKGKQVIEQAYKVLTGRDFGTGDTKQRGFNKQITDTIPNYTERNYREMSNKETLAAANDLYNELGAENALTLFMSDNKELHPALMNTLGMVIMQRAREYGPGIEADVFIETERILAERGTVMGQANQVFSLWKEISPEGAKAYAAKLNRKALQAKAGDKPKNAKVAVQKAVDNAIDQTAAAVQGDPVKVNTKETVSTTYGKDNKRISRSRAKEIKDKLKSKFGGKTQFSILSQTQPTDSDLLELAMFHLEAGGQSFEDFADHMVKDLGVGIRPYLKQYYNEAAKELDVTPQTEAQVDAVISRIYAEEVAARVVSKAKDTTEKKDPIKILINTLLQKVTAKGTHTKTVTDIEKIRDAVLNKEEYAGVWDRSKQIVLDKINAMNISAAEKAAMTQKLEDYFKELIGEPFSRRLVSAEVGRAIQGHNLRKLLKSYYGIRKETRGTIKDFIIAQTGLPPHMARELGQAIEEEYDARLKKELDKVMDSLKKNLEKSIAKESEVKKRKDQTDALYKEITELVNLGAFTDDDFLKLYAKKNGWKSPTKAQLDKLGDLANEVQKQKQYGTKISENKAVEDLLAYQKELSGLRWHEVPMAIWYANVLSGHNTQIINTVSNLLRIATEMGVGAAKNPKNLIYMPIGFMKGLGIGVTEAIETWKTGYSPIRGKVEVPAVLERKITGPYKYPAWVLKYVRRAMVAADVLMFEGASEMRAYQLARQKLKTYGEGDYSALNQSNFKKVQDILGYDATTVEKAEEYASQHAEKGTRLWKRIKTSYIHSSEGRDSEITRDANEFGRQVTYNYPPEGMLGMAANLINQGTNRYPAFKLVVPFTNIIANVANEYLNYTPVGLARAIRGGYITPKKYHNRTMTKDEIADLYVKAIGGMVLMTTLAILSSGDDPFIEITANGYNDYQKNKNLPNFHPYSFRIKGTDTWIPYRYSPLYFVFAPVGHFHDANKYMRNKELESEWSKVAVMMQRSISGFFDSTFLSSVNTLMSSLFGGERGEGGDMLEKFMRNTVTTATSFVVPNELYQGSQLIADVASVPQKELGDKWYARLLSTMPFAMDNLNNRVDMLGFYINDYAPRIVRNFDDMPGKELQFLELMSKNKTAIRQETFRQFNGHGILDENGVSHEITNQQYHDYMLVRGRKMYYWMQDNFEALAKMDEEHFRAEFSAALSQATIAAKKTIGHVPKQSEMDEIDAILNPLGSVGIPTARNMGIKTTARDLLSFSLVDIDMNPVEQSVIDEWVKENLAEVEKD